MELVGGSLRTFQATLRATEPMAADFVWDLSTVDDWPDARQYFGPGGFNEFIAKWTEAYDEFEQRTEEVIDAGDRDVVSIVSQRGRPRGSESWVHLRFAIVWTVTEGELHRGRVFVTAEQALEAVGLSE